MTILQILQLLALILTIGTGLLSLLAPLSVQGFTGLNVAGGRGVTEIRAIFGGLFIGLGLAVFVLGTRQTYQMLGIMYLTIAAARLVSIFVDKSSTQSNWVSAAAEVALGIVLVL